jgi:hypothetical protein
MSERFDRSIHYSRIIFMVLAWLFALSVLVQTLFAGLAIFTNPTYWSHHTSFVPWFQFIPIVMFGLSFSGKLPSTLRWQCVALFLLIVPLQYANMHIPGMGAIHPVVALVLFWLAIQVARKTTVQVRRI